MLQFCLVTCLLVNAPVPRVPTPTPTPTPLPVSIDAVRSTAPAEGRPLLLELGDARVLCTIERVRAHGDERYTVSGRVPGAPGGTFAIARCRDALHGIVRIGTLGTWELRSADGAPLVTRRVPEQPTECTCGAHLSANGPAAPLLPLAGPGSDPDDGSAIDLLVVFRDAVAAHVGGVNAMIALIDLGAEENNIAWAASGIASEIRVVHMQQYPGPVLGLGDLAGTDDGLYDDVHVLRNAYAADQVVEIVDSNGGVAMGLVELDPEQQSRMFCQVGDGAIPNATFAHEVGHNMGCCHAFGDGGGCPSEGGLLFPFSNGHRFFGTSGAQWRTVMAYSPGTRFLGFSSPTGEHDGVPTGFPPDESSPGADNTATIDTSRVLVATFRSSQLAPCRALDLPPDAPDCNRNGMPDACEIEIGHLLDLDDDGVPDVCECPMDFDGNGMVGFDDLVEFLALYGGTCAHLPGAPCFGDFDEDEFIGFTDLVILLSQWGPCLD